MGNLNNEREQIANFMKPALKKRFTCPENIKTCINDCTLCLADFILALLKEQGWKSPTEIKEIITKSAEGLADQHRKHTEEARRAGIREGRRQIIRLISKRAYPEDGDGYEFFFDEKEYLALLKELDNT